MAASRHTRKRTNAATKKLPLHVQKASSKKSGIKADDGKTAQTFEESLDPKAVGNDKSAAEALENQSSDAIHGKSAAQNDSANVNLSPPESLKKVPCDINVQPSSANEWTRQQQQQQYPVFSPLQQQQQQQQQQIMQMMMSAGMMNPSTQGATFMQYNNNNKGGGGGGGLYGIPANPSHHHNQNLLLVGNPIHDFLQMQQNPTAFPARYLINAQNGPFPFPWPPVEMPPFPTLPTGMTVQNQIDNATAITPKTKKSNEDVWDAQQQKEGKDGESDKNRNEKNTFQKKAAAENEKYEKETTTTRLAENGSGMSSDNFQTATATANKSFGSVSSGKKTATKVLPTEEQLEHRQRYLQQQQQLNQFNAFNSLQQSGAAYSAYAAALSMGQLNADSPSFAAQRAFQQHQKQQQYLHNLLNNNFNSNEQQQHRHHQLQQHEYQQVPPHQPTTTTQKKGKQGVPKSNRSRLVWNDELHKRFMDAVNHLGLDAAVPKTIMQMMKVEGLTRENIASHLQKYRLKQMAAEKKAAMNTNSTMNKNTSHSTMDDSYYAGDGKELNGNAPSKKGASLKRSAAEKTDIEGTKKSKTENEGTDDAVAAAAEINVTATTTNGAPGAHDGKDSGESSDGRDASNSGGENDSKNPPQHHINTNENEQHQQELQKKQQRTKRWKSSSDDETSDKDNFGQQQRAGVVGN